MQILTQQIERVLTRVLEAMETDPESADHKPLQVDEYDEGRDCGLDTDTHTLIELCW
jgi:hypothetical protein